MVTKNAQAQQIQTLEIQTENVDGYLVVRLVGEVDLATAPALKETLLKLLCRQDEPLAVDLGGLGFIDAAGLSALVAGYNRAKQLDRDYRLAEPTPQVARVLKLTAIDTLIPVHSSLTDACTALPVPRHITRSAKPRPSRR
jgi:anti-sigma B factor antagonist